MFGLRPDDWLERVRRASRRTVEFGIRGRLLPSRVRHIHGATAVRYGPDDVLVIVVVRNGASYVDAYVEHHQRMGAAHIVALDNGSTDGTIDLLRAHAGVTVLQTDAPYATYENTMKRYLAERFSAGRWNLTADIDEHFDYPGSDRLPLSGFLRYLNAHRFSAVAAQLLDLFAAHPIADARDEPGGSLLDRYPYYDTSAVDRRPYEWSDTPAPDVRMHWGGIRRTRFGTDNGLTKAALVLMNGRVRPFVNWHHATGARVADVTGLLRHFPFTSNFRAKVADAVDSGRYGTTTTNEYEKYGAQLQRHPDLSLLTPTAQRYAGLQPLLDDGFIVMSDQYRRWVDAHGSQGAGDRRSTRPQT